jgi:amidohydrolase
MHPVGDPPGVHDLIAAAVAALEPELVALRRDLHAHPEPSWGEHRTTSVLLERLRAAGLGADIAPTGTGVVCDIGSGSPVVAIRGDIDALPMVDTKAVAYRSVHEGMCHACGHDLHAASALGAALALAATFEECTVEGTVRLILQPAEEAVPGGAAALVAAGALDGVSAVFGLHADPTRPVGTIGVSPGAITSAADQVTLSLRGPGGHTGRPHLTADLVHIASRVAVDLPMGLGRLSDPRDGVNLTFGSLRAGTVANVIPTEAVLLGSLRASGRGAWEAAPGHVRSLVRAIVEPLGATWELDHQRGAPPIVNDPWAVEQVVRAGAAVVGADAVGPTEQSAGGEDFSWYGDLAPLGYLRVGVRAPGAERVDLHTASFDVDERAIAIGARVLAGAAVEAIADLAVQGSG